YVHRYLHHEAAGTQSAPTPALAPLSRNQITPGLFFALNFHRPSTLRPCPPSPVLSAVTLAADYAHSRAASAATTAPGGTAMPSVRLQGARRGYSRPRSRQAADRSVNAP